VLADDPQKQFEALKERILQQIQGTFPIRSRQDRFEVRVSNLSVQDALGVDDIKGQVKARLEGRSWAAPIHGDIEVVDAKTGKPLVRQEAVQIASIPKLTRHYSYIVGGQEKFIVNQWRLRSGPYVKSTERENEYEAQFQLAKGKSFDIQMDPESGSLHIRMGSRKIPLYSVLKAYGVSDDRMKKAWGDENFRATTAKSKLGKDLQSLHTAWRGSAAEGDPALAVKALFAETQMDPVIAEANLGMARGHVDGDVLLRASHKLVDVASGKTAPDPIDSLRYKELWEAKDQFSDRLAQSKNEITRRVQSALDKKGVRTRLFSGDRKVLRDVVMPDLIQRPVYHLFTDTSLASNGKQTNPLAMLSDRSMATLMGSGGIQNPHQITSSNTAIDPSHLGFLDPVFTPESNPGVNTHLAAGVRIKDRKPYIRLYNTRTGKTEEVDAAKAAGANVVMPDQVTWKGGKPKPVGATVRASDRKGQVRDLPWSQAQYVLLSPAQVFAVETNLVPFMQNDSAGRTTMSARHMAQAISIVGREAPKVQVEAGGNKSFEQILGSTFLAHRAPVNGVVKHVRRDSTGGSGSVVIEDGQGKSHTVALYDHYPTNHLKGQLHSTPSAKPGDRVRKGQLLADNNYTKDGVLALGTNLRTAYLANGSNHEDGIVISRRAAEQLGSEHLYKPAMMLTPTTKIDKKAFLLSKPAAYASARLEHVGDDGVIKPGVRVKPGDPLVLALNEHTKAEAVGSLDARNQRRLGAKLRNKYTNSSLVWDADYEGEVVRVVRSGKNITVHVKTLEPAQVGSKLSTRHSAKGIVAAILDNKDMPVDKKGKQVDLLLNPLGVPGRMNAGQVLETAAGKIADKTGKPYIIKNFEAGSDYLKKVRGDLKKHHLKETETLYDPKTGRKLGEITVGPHYVFQLEHQIDKKTHVRSGGMSFSQTGAPKLPYDTDTKQPRDGAQSLGVLGMYGALAAGLHNNLREMQTLKSDQDQALEVWGAITNGDRLPAPRVPFVYHKFEAMLKTLGVDTKKEGAGTRLIPRTDAETRTMSRGEIKKPNLSIRGKDDQPEKGGLFDRTVTGGPGGKHWGHIELIEPVPNPIYSKAIALTLGLDARQPDSALLKIMQEKGKGPRYLYEQLKKIDVDKELKKTKSLIDDPKTKGATLDKLTFKYKALKNLKDAGKHPADIWAMKAVPVLPPVFRPQGTLPDGTLKNNPLNELYKRVGMLNESLKKSGDRIPYNANIDARAALYSELQNLFGTTPKGKKVLDTGRGRNKGKPLPGVVHMLAGEQPKDGFFQKKMVGKKQDYTARATIVADPNLSVEEIGIPEKIAIELFRPMVARRLLPLTRDPMQAHKLISQKDPMAVRALEQELEDRPVIMKRDPVLHQYGLVAQKVKLTKSSAIRMSPLILPPVGGDIDGDTVALFAPLTNEAVEEARKILPSQRMLSDSSGEVLYKPANESALALYRTSLPRGNKRALRFASQKEVEAAFKANRVALNDVVTVAGIGETTLGRLRIAHIVPEAHRAQILTDLKTPFDKKFQDKVLKETAKEHPKHFLEMADNLSRLGFRMAYESGHTITLQDLEPLRKQRAQVISQATRQVQKLPQSQKTEKWLQATRALHDVYNRHYDRRPTNISDMSKAGIKVKREQLQGLVMAPMLVEDHLGKPSLVPLTKSFAEGLDVGGYFLQAAGARRGTIQKVKSVSEPGYMTKLLVQANIDQPITTVDCGATSGVLMPIGDKDVVDRRLASAVKVGAKTYQAGAAVTPTMLAQAKEQGVNKLLVRSPLKCRAPQGVCSHCMGMRPTGRDYSIGENVGVISAQALGERAAQLMLRQTHGGGIVPLSGQSTEDFTQVQRLFDAAKRGESAARVAPVSGTVQKVVSTRGKHFIYMTGRKLPIRAAQKPLEHVRAGATVQRGDTLTQGVTNIHDILKTKGLDAVQQEMATRIGDVYAKEGVLRRHAELTVRSATSMVRVVDPGDHDSIFRGDTLMKPVIDELNRTVLKGKRPIRYEASLTAIKMAPLRRVSDFVARLQGERIGQHITTAIQHGQSTSTAGAHPIPGLAHGAAHRPYPR
jgi:DNA-directed RNA polymerase subunit beta'